MKLKKEKKRKEEEARYEAQANRSCSQNKQRCAYIILCINIPSRLSSPASDIMKVKIPYCSAF